jgi:hypothetical protein
MLMYYREYRSQFHIGITYGISESRVCEIINEMKHILIADKHFHLPGKRVLLKEENQFEVVLLEVTESPKDVLKKQRRNYSGKKKRHTQKMQLVAEKKTRKIICTAFGNGRKHDFRLLKKVKFIFILTPNGQWTQDTKVSQRFIQML